MLNLIYRYLYDRLMANELLHIFGFVEPSLILKPIAPSASVDEWGVALAN